MFEFFNLLTHLPFTILREGGQTVEKRQNMIICRTNFFILFHLYIYPPDSQESVGSAILGASNYRFWRCQDIAF